MKIIQRGSDAKEKTENFERKSIPTKVVVMQDNLTEKGKRYFESFYSKPIH